jgi:hypothetical protein
MSISAVTSAYASECPTTPSTFEELVSSLATVAGEVVVFLDNIHYADVLEPETSKKFLALSELAANPRIKVIGATNTYLTARCFRIGFTPYADTQFTIILESKIAQEQGRDTQRQVLHSALPNLLAGSRHCGILWNSVAAIQHSVSAESAVDRTYIEIRATEAVQLSQLQRLADNSMQCKSTLSIIICIWELI